MSSTWRRSAKPRRQLVPSQVSIAVRGLLRDGADLRLQVAILEGDFLAAAEVGSIGPPGSVARALETCGITLQADAQRV